MKKFIENSYIDEQSDQCILYSYNTKVALFDKQSGNLYFNGWYSKTTARHVLQFCKMMVTDFDNLLHTMMKQNKFKTYKDVLNTVKVFNTDGTILLKL